MDIIAVCLFAVTAAVLCRAVSSNAGNAGIALTVAAAAMIFIKTADSLGSIAAEIRSLFEQSGVASQYVRILLKGLGICYITNFARGVCCDSGEYTLAEQTLLAGKISLLVISLPMIDALIEIVKELLA